MTEDVERAAILLREAYARGELSEGSTQALLAAGDIGPEVEDALGVAGTAASLVLVTILVDDTASLGAIPQGAEAVRLGHNRCLDVLKEQDATEVLVHTRTLNQGSISPYCKLTEAAQLTTDNYQPIWPSTPLYRQTVVTLGAVMAKARDEKERGRRVHAFTLIITDGQDNASGEITVDHVRFLVRDMLEFSKGYAVAGMGIGSPEEFQRIFGAMGIPKDRLFTADATEEDILKSFQEIAEQLQLEASKEDYQTEPARDENSDSESGDE